MILVISSKRVYAAARLLQESSKIKLGVKILDMGDLVASGFRVDLKKFAVLYVRDPYHKGSPKYIPDVIKLAKKFKAAGKKVVDAKIANGNLGNGKWADYKLLQSAGLPIPKTRIFTDYPLSTIHYPLVLKWIYGMKGKNVFLVNDHSQLKKILPLHPKTEWLIQEYIEADWEMEVYVIGFKPVPVVLEYKIKNGFKADAKNYKIFKGPRNYRILKAAASAAKKLGREMCKIDILVCGKKFYILEVNRNPGLVSFETLIGYNIARDFARYLSRKEKYVKIDKRKT